MKKFINLLFSLLVLVSTQSFAENAWEFFNYEEYCVIQASPVKTEIPEGKSRGDYGLIVYRMHKSSELTVQITPGFDYKSIDSVEVKIDENSYDFYTDTDVAWTKEDGKVIYAMKKGLNFITVSLSSKGTKVIDTYTLKGFTSAVNKLTNDC